MSFKEWIEYQIHPFAKSHVSHYDLDDEEDIPGYWSKGKFLTDKNFYLGTGLLVFLFWFLSR